MEDLRAVEANASGLDSEAVHTARIEHADGTYQITVPKRELAAGTLTEDETYRIALISTTESGTDITESDLDHGVDSDEHQPEYDGPPVTEGEHRDVEIEHLGDQGDGITKVEHGYVVIVPDTSVGDRVTVEIQQVRENVAFGEVVTRHPRSRQ
ncbi:TRAM domain-containing protein [Halorubrum ezzemoulense]|uniref:TRAM domain-containing protein n=1 Tax=Halorubrum ezzemoulense TaxID=337243 RepID=UPI00232C6935|nr:TRAM domain-containing protein [Halorubrum ezzemoulense]MDB9250662.1 TRAM domain-containing protein [Halorubrum ezzemoulense]MDB9252994.1 TRAM domain-containing protein [Halorubrum ezzemoulense]MDB9256621.1 TRAM domain-containing protein [Halorubrum ezzemoulense]MDB9260802.1 TRAM domain-containing protein [Halorubrum ezzemoulense]MDB9264254.1 TRAM domain-containing protein [Halorubrum ezzemoulense]